MSTFDGELRLYEVSSKGSSVYCNGNDWLSFINTGDTDASLDGVVVSDSKGPTDDRAFTFPANTVLAAKSTLRMCQSTNAGSTLDFVFNFGIGDTDEISLWRWGTVVDSVQLRGISAFDYVWTFNFLRRTWGNENFETNPPDERVTVVDTWAAIGDCVPSTDGGALQLVAGADHVCFAVVRQPSLLLAHLRRRWEQSMLEEAFPCLRNWVCTFPQIERRHLLFAHALASSMRTNCQHICHLFLRTEPHGVVRGAAMWCGAVRLCGAVCVVVRALLLFASRHILNIRL
jgi:hypothetical protein